MYFCAMNDPFKAVGSSDCNRKLSLVFKVNLYYI